MESTLFQGSFTAGIYIGVRFMTPSGKEPSRLVWSDSVWDLGVEASDYGRVRLHKDDRGALRDC